VFCSYTLVWFTCNDETETFK